MKTLIFALMTGLLLTTTSAHATTTLTLSPPGGAISGPAGSTVGWGFTFVNDTNFAVITGTQFCGTGSTPPICLPLSPNLGTYTDIAGSQFLVIGPSPESPSVTQSFDSALNTGLGSFTLSSTASGTVSGIIEVSYDLFSVSPNSPNFSFEDVIANGLFLTSPASVTVGPAAAVAEPGTLLLLASGFAATLLRRRRAEERV
jgi:hypothetical protein